MLNVQSSVKYKSNEFTYTQEGRPRLAELIALLTQRTCSDTDSSTDPSDGFAENHSFHAGALQRGEPASLLHSRAPEGALSPGRRRPWESMHKCRPNTSAIERR